MVKKLTLFLFFLIFFPSCSLGLEANFTIQSSDYVNMTGNNFVNITIGAENANISQVTFVFDGDFVGNSNGSSASDFTFTNTTSSGSGIIMFTNTTSSGIIENQTMQDFWFGITSLGIGDLTITINATAFDGTSNSSIIGLTANIPFYGYVKNESGNLQNGTNISIYQFILQQNGPPSEILEASTLTDENGSFSFLSLNGSAQMYILKLIHYNQSGYATKIGAILPAFPITLYYPTATNELSDMTLNGSTFYLQAAGTLRLNVTNSTGDSHKFGYMVYDEKVGFPVESQMLQSVSTVDVVVPAGKSYTVMFVREFSQFLGNQDCDGTFMNDTNCPTPPKSNSSLSVSEGQVLQVTQDLSITRIRLTGCIKISPNYNETSLTQYNLTSLIPKLQPWAGFIPPAHADQGDINLTADISYNLTLHPECNSSYHTNGIAWYNISLLGAVPYMLEFYAKNASSEAGKGGLYLAGFSNLTTNTTGADELNITLYKLLGSYYSGGLVSVNTSVLQINIQNETGGAITNSLNADVKVKNAAAGFGTVTYIIETITNGTFYLPILNNSNWVEVSVYSNDGPPIEKVLNLSKSEHNITLVSIDFSAGGDKGLREMNSTGDLVEINASSMPILMTFYRAGTSQVITSMNATNFNPLKALVAGSVDLEIEVIATGVKMKFNNFDMFSAKQPPMFAVIDNASLASSTGTWEFGNFVPSDVYDNVTLIIPYDASLVNESWNYNMSIPLLYQEDPNNPHQFSTAWNRSAGHTDTNLTDQFIEYNNSRYSGYLTSAGVVCDKGNGAAVCYMDTTNNRIQMEIPHFSGLSPSVTGAAPAVSSSSDDDDSSSSGGGGDDDSESDTTKVVRSWTNMYRGESYSMSVNSAKIGIEKIDLEVSSNTSSVKITVTGYTSRPSVVSKPKPGKIYGYIQILPVSLDDNLSRAMITLKLNDTWVTKEVGDKDNVAIFKFNEDSEEWGEVATRYKKKSGNYHYYEANVTSFSYFAISEKVVSSDTANDDSSTGDALGNETVDIEAQVQASKRNTLLWILGGAIIIVLIVIIVLAGIEYKDKIFKKKDK
ncbi:MAG: PGF-pre-PGF domain-containing protein [archaeon]